jgi:midasin (ATPase involved in ribosome maturation)
MKKEKLMFEKEMEEYQKLAGWNSTNYAVLKSTVEKFHGKIHKINKRYKDFLIEPMRVHVFETFRKKLLVDSFEIFLNTYQN